jgi:hypothetical protein
VQHTQPDRLTFLYGLGELKLGKRYSNLRCFVALLGARLPYTNAVPSHTHYLLLNVLHTGMWYTGQNIKIDMSTASSKDILRTALFW